MARYNGAMTVDRKRYADLIHDLAMRAVDAAEKTPDAAGHRPRVGETWFRLTQVLPAARVLLVGGTAPDVSDEALAALVDPKVRVTDGRGHTRGVYRQLASHIFERAGVEVPMATGRGHEVVGADVAEQAWAILNASPDADVFPLDHLPPGEGALHVQDVDDGLDHWTYCELVALHAWDALTRRHGSQAGRDRVAAAARFHQGHTQPDYTTYQPWALAAFLEADDTAAFAEQQLHDVRHHLAIEGGAGAVVVALLLSDAYASWMAKG